MTSSVGSVAGIFTVGLVVGPAVEELAVDESGVDESVFTESVELVELFELPHPARTTRQVRQATVMVSWRRISPTLSGFVLAWVCTTLPQPFVFGEPHRG